VGNIVVCSRPHFCDTPASVKPRGVRCNVGDSAVEKAVKG